MNELKIVKNTNINGVSCDFYSNETGEFYMTRQQIGQALEYDNPNKQIDKLHQRHKERLDKFSTTVKMTVVEGNRKVNREMILYSAKGVYEICR